MSAELRFIETSIRSNKAILGICLGAQLVARSLGARVYKNKDKEIGWFPVQRTPQSMNTDILKSWPESFQTFHWHGDTFDIPEGAVRIASSEACANQGFFYGDKTVALQFHPETTKADLELFLSNSGSTCNSGERFIQTAEQIRENIPLIPAMNEKLFKMLDTMVEKTQ